MSDDVNRDGDSRPRGTSSAAFTIAAVALNLLIFIALVTLPAAILGIARHSSSPALVADFAASRERLAKVRERDEAADLAIESFEAPAVATRIDDAAAQRLREWSSLLETITTQPAPEPTPQPSIEEVLEPPTEPSPPMDDEVAETPRIGETPAERRRLAAQFGATVATENAVDAGLEWLAAHQSASGFWDAIDFRLQCPNSDRCGHPAIRRIGQPIRVGLTGLCLLAFLGAGYTDADGPYADNIARAKDALLRVQEPSGGFGGDHIMSGYDDALATLALAEYYVQTNDSRVGGALPAAVVRLADTQQRLGGWDYYPTQESNRNDTSITAWVVQALQTCAAAGIEVPARTQIRAALHFARATDDGIVWYADAGEGFKLDQNFQAKYRYGPGMIACGHLSEMLLGWREASSDIRKMRARMLRNPPSEFKARGRDSTQLHSQYYWYYGTVGFFQIGGDDWDRWNAALRDALLPLQDRSKDRDGRKAHTYGSWPAYGPNWGKWGRLGGRVYTTAIGTLTLETYYRHKPAYLKSPSFVRAEDWLRFIHEASEREKRYAIEVCEQLRFEIGEPVLVALLDDESGRIARDAAEALIAIESPMGLELLVHLFKTMPPWGLDRAEAMIRRAEELRALPQVEGRIVRFDPVLRLAVVELPRAYVGMPLARRDVAARGLAEFRVMRRYTDHARVLLEWSPVGSAEMPRVGDVVVSVERQGARFERPF